jgi:putative ABC transport system substrate-binding protein
MKRREFIAILAGAAVGPLAARAQRPAMPVIGFLGGASPTGYAPLVESLRLGLRDHGYVEGINAAIEYRWAEGHYDRLPALAADLVRLNVDLIVTQGTPAALAAKQATTTIPIVMAIVGNPDDTGIVSSLGRPGGNITGLSYFWAEINAKRLELMKELVPGLTRAGVLMNSGNPAMPSILRAMRTTAKMVNVALHPVDVSALDELDAAFARAKTQVEALTIVDDGLLIANANRVAQLAMIMQLPSIGFSEYCEAGGLAGYGVDFPYIWRRAATFVDRILKGTKPADLPIEQATRFMFTVNLKTARTLGITIPQLILARADSVIE